MLQLLLQSREINEVVPVRGRRSFHQLDAPHEMRRQQIIGATRSAASV